MTSPLSPFGVAAPGGRRVNPAATVKGRGGEPTLPTLHVPVFRHPTGAALPDGFAYCLRCERLVTLVTFVRDTCPGKERAA